MGAGKQTPVGSHPGELLLGQVLIFAPSLSFRVQMGAWWRRGVHMALAERGNLGRIWGGKRGGTAGQEGCGQPGKGMAVS